MDKSRGSFTKEFFLINPIFHIENFIEELLLTLKKYKKAYDIPEETLKRYLIIWDNVFGNEPLTIYNLNRIRFIPKKQLAMLILYGLNYYDYLINHKDTLKDSFDNNLKQFLNGSDKIDFSNKKKYYKYDSLEHAVYHILTYYKEEVGYHLITEKYRILYALERAGF